MQPRRSRQVKRRVALWVCEVDIGTGLDESDGGPLVTTDAGLMERREAVRVGRVGSGTAPHENLHKGSRLVAVRCHEMQGRASTLLLGVVGIDFF